MSQTAPTALNETDLILLRRLIAVTKDFCRYTSDQNIAEAKIISGVLAERFGQPITAPVLALEVAA